MASDTAGADPALPPNAKRSRRRRWLITISSALVGLILVAVAITFILYQNMMCDEVQNFPEFAALNEERTAVTDADNREAKDVQVALGTEKTKPRGGC